MASQNISKKRKFVADGVFYSELNEVSIRLISILYYASHMVFGQPVIERVIFPGNNLIVFLLTPVNLHSLRCVVIILS